MLASLETSVLAFPETGKNIFVSRNDCLTEPEQLNLLTFQARPAAHLMAKQTQENSEKQNSADFDSV